MAHEALTQLHGLFTGVKMGGCTTHDAFHLAPEWTVVKQFDCHRRFCIKDRVWIYGLIDEDKRPILNRSKPTAWLNYVHANLQAIHWNGLKRGVWEKSEGKLSVFFAYPLTLELLLENIETQASYLLRAKRQNVQSVTFITLNIGRNHWTLLSIDNQTLKNILYFDSLGYQIPSSLRHALANLFPCLHRGWI